METTQIRTETSIEDTANIFREPWEDSDAVLVVEDQKFHVHRLMLSMASPVFKAMLSSNFKEKDAGDIELPGKKANEILDLLKMIYPQERGDITIDNVEHIAKLADEYQMKSLLSTCEKFLLAKSKSQKEHGMKILLLAQQLNMRSVQESCYKELKGMKIAQFQEFEGFEDLDGDSLRGLLVPRIEKLEKVLQDVYPQLVGLLDFAMCLYQESGRGIAGCPYHGSQHFMQQIKGCFVCREMLRTMATGYPGSRNNKHYPYYSSENRTFNGNVTTVLEELIPMLEMNP